MRILRTLRNYFLYCGIEKDEYNAVKKDAYISNFVVWQSLHIFMTVIFGALFITTFFNVPLTINRVFYFCAFLYSGIFMWFFFILKKDSLLAQFLIYISITMLFLLGGFITKNNPVAPATTFIALLLITPMFMIDKPFFMTMELCGVSTILIIWMHSVKAYDVWKEKKNYGKVSMGVVRTTYLIDEKGIITKANDKVKAADNPQEMLEAIGG